MDQFHMKLLYAINNKEPTSSEIKSQLVISFVVKYNININNNIF